MKKENTENKKIKTNKKENIKEVKEKKVKKSKVKKEKKPRKEKKKIDKSVLLKRRFKVVLAICLTIIIAELIIMYCMNLNKESKMTYYDALNSIRAVDDEYYIASGSSNFKYSRYNDSFIYEYHDENFEDKPVKQAYAEQAKLVKYDKELNVLFEKTFETSYDSTFYDAIVTNNAIYAVGSYIYEESQISLQTRDGLLVKYDLEGNMLWHKNFQILGDTEFKRILPVSDGIIVVGQSIYENMQIGNHNMGGGIIIKYDFEGNVVWNNSFGGNKSGIFNDVVAVNDGYICVGKDAVNYGLIAKFSLDGELMWIKNYANTDEIGFTKAEIKDDKLYIAGAYNKSEEKDEDGNQKFEYDAAIFVYDLNGELLDKYTIGGSKTDRFNSMVLTDDKIIAIGYAKSDDIELDNLNYKDKMVEGMVISFDYNGKIVDKLTYGGSKNETLTSIIESITKTENIINNTKDYVIVGYSNSKRGVFKGNGKDYFSKVIKIDSNLNILEEK